MKQVNMAQILATLALFLCASIAGSAIGAPPGYRAGQASAAQVLMMPKFCWWEFDARYAHTQQLIQNCGPMMNHYCIAELNFIFSKDRSRPQSERLGKLGAALHETEYTLKGMTGYPACSIRGHVTRKYGEMRASFISFGRPLPPSILGAPSR
ncbi:MAG: hypothetical protein IPM40_13620 [Gammaproteobacteria bacterium]|nr:hypothetical protein [Gammaproteobacteria bacterium]